MSENGKKPVRTLALHVDAEAPLDAAWKAISQGEHISRWFAPEAESHGSGEGSRLTFAWSEQMRWTTHVVAWDEGRRVRWFDQGVLGENTALAAEWTLEAAGGRTRITLVQSAFGENDGWDDFFAGTEVGWTYFLYNLRLYLERHFGRPRRMVSRRFPVAIPRDEAWRRTLSTSGFIAGAGAAVQEGAAVTVALGAERLPAQVELAIEGRALALRFPGLQDAVLFLEFETGAEPFSLGNWFSLYDVAAAERIRQPAIQAFEDLARALESPPG